MSSLLESTRNTRSITPGSYRYVRSDAVWRPTGRDVAWLRENGITTVVDLRSRDELGKRPCPLAENEAFTYYSMPITGGDQVPDSPGKVAAWYLNTVDGKMDEVIHTIESAKTGVIFFCTAGKDRAGVVSAILQKRMGVSDDEIVADYMLTGENLKTLLEGCAAQHPEIRLDVITPREEYMRGFLHGYSENFFRLETERLKMRRITPADYLFAFAWSGDTRVTKYLKHETLKKPEDMIPWLSSLDQASGEAYILILREKEDGHAVGTLGFFYDSGSDAWSIAYNIRYEDWGKGYATEAAAAMMDYLRKVHGAHRFEGECAKNNIGSARVMEKLGMKYSHDSTYEKYDGTVLRSKVMILED